MDKPQGEGSFERWGSHFDNQVKVEILGHEIILKQDPSDTMLDETGSTVWDIARIFVTFLTRDLFSKKLAKKRVIELGAGE